MNTIQEWYPFFWAMIAVLISLIAVLLEILNNEYEMKAERKRFNLRSKAYFLMMQNRGAM